MLDKAVAPMQLAVGMSVVTNACGQVVVTNPFADDEPDAVQLATGTLSALLAVHVVAVKLLLLLAVAETQVSEPAGPLVTVPQLVEV